MKAVLRKAAEVAIGAFVLGSIIAAVCHMAFGYGPAVEPPFGLRFGMKRTEIVATLKRGGWTAQGGSDGGHELYFDKDWNKFFSATLNDSGKAKMYTLMVTERDDKKAFEEVKKLLVRAVNLWGDPDEADDNAAIWEVEDARFVVRREGQRVFVAWMCMKM